MDSFIYLHLIDLQYLQKFEAFKVLDEQLCRDTLSGSLEEPPWDRGGLIAHLGDSTRATVINNKQSRDEWVSKEATSDHASTENQLRRTLLHVIGLRSEQICRKY